MPLDTFNYQPFDYYNPNPDELQEFITRVVNASVQWHINNNTDSFFAGTLVEPKETNENIGLLRDSNQYSTLITIEPDWNANENYKLDGNRSLSEATRQYWIKSYIRIRTKREVGLNTVLLQMENYLQRSMTRSNTSYSSQLTTGEGWSGYTYTTYMYCNRVASDESSVVIDPETRAYFKEFSILFGIFREA